MISAKEAKQQALEVINKKHKKIFEEVEEKIKAAIQLGELDVSCGHEIPDFVKNKLTDLGYQVKTIQCGMNEWATEISWADAELVEL